MIYIVGENRLTMTAFGDGMKLCMWEQDSVTESSEVETSYIVGLASTATSKAAITLYKTQDEQKAQSVLTRLIQALMNTIDRNHSEGDRYICLDPIIGTGE